MNIKRKFLSVIFLITLALLGFYILNTDETAELSEKTNIFIITLESTRADQLPCYGHYRNTSPNICELAENDGILFENAISPSSWTLPSLSSMLTSKHPNKLGTTKPISKLGDQYLTLPEYLNEKNYETHAYTASPYTREVHNLNQGFDIYKDHVYQKTKSGDLFEKGKKNIENTSKNIFTWFHLPEAHQGHSPPENFTDVFSKNISSNISANQIKTDFAQLNLTDEDVKYIKAKYNEEIKYADHAIGNFIDNLKTNKMYNDSIIIITSDHGSDFMEHGHIGHGLDLYDVSINVPFVMKMPNNTLAGERIEKTISLVDVFPTISSILNDEPKGLQGVNLIDVIEGKSSRNKVVSQMLNKTALRYKDSKYIYSKSEHVIDEQGNLNVNNYRTPLMQYYNLNDDPKEQQNIIEELGEDELQKKFRKVKSLEINDGEIINLSAEDEERLRNLGYLN